MSAWISVKDANADVPPWVFVLAFPDREGCITLMTRSDFSGRWLNEAGGDEQPTHWMPLPEPPK